ncbi:uncharacterized protein LOC118495859 [Sander lucioperca]|uniref:uncharacterized protein LOC118495859 n=1 Tax=Sander lucioperca TaxID=283035 RepID=UPI0016538BE5|nr:uncharacterized protein LOC118495859 [Sander lucioperca]
MSFSPYKQKRLQWKFLFTDECHANLDGPDGWSSGRLVDGHHVPIRLRRQQGGGGVMFWSGIMGRELALWIGICHHVCNIHTWQIGSCQHGDLGEGLGKQWIQRYSKSHKALVDIVFNKRWLKDVHKYLRFRSTADLESFQNHFLMYASKRYAFTPPVYEARVLLAALDYNFHCNRPTSTTSEGKQIVSEDCTTNMQDDTACTP